MRPMNVEELLWEMSRTVEPETAGGAPPGGGVPVEAWLDRYRAGRLTDAEAEQVEAWLGRDERARQKLGERAVAGETPPSRVRRDVLAAFVKPAVHPRASRATRRWVFVRAAAYRPVWTLALAGLLAALWLRSVPPAPPLDLQYEVNVRALALRRAAPPAGEVARAFADTIVRIEASPEGMASADIEVGLYRAWGGVLRRLRPEAVQRVASERGAAAFEARASDLVGPTPGTHEVYVVVGRRGDLPAALDLTLADAADADRYRIYARRIELLSRFVEPEERP